MTFNTLLSLTTEKIVWSVRVRAQAGWKGINRKTNEFKGFNIIFIDEQSCRIHAFMSEKLCHGFAEDLKEGQLYSLSNFKVHQYKGDEINRCVRNEKHIYFDNQTQFQKIVTDVPLMKEYAFDLFDLQDIPKFLNDNRFLIDVVGMCQKSAVTCLVSAEEPSKSRVKFKLYDGSSRQTYSVMQCLANQEIYLTNYPAMRFYINPNHYSVSKIQKSMILGTEDKDEDATFFTVKQIKQLGKDYIQKSILCKVTVKKVDEQCNWFDNFHIKCENEVTIVDGRNRCAHCKRNLPYPDKRFRVCTICADETGVLPIIFPDDEIKRITGKDVYDLENENREAGDEKRFPPVLKEFQCKQYIMTLMPSKENIENQSTMYIAKKPCDPLEMLGNHNPVEELSPYIEEISMNTEFDSTKNNMSYSSPPTLKSTNRTRGRKNKLSVKIELDDGDHVSKVKKS
ncbi:hypothetical protein POM88_036209 [Heracleum sosnowskyi]|uniref:Replication factor A C-terminal domain-containing protein n=1 Tax=Heracleum sosnowskyi TaxID=360622 RepID=A0AAD8HMQ3_9APIA|nr:hypothetical protein POM88_036209 [Heracleum sosnowskyi]